ncbi:MAG: energy-coupling factor transporter transmembrane component T [Clostridiaceae bacterium]
MDLQELHSRVCTTARGKFWLDLNPMTKLCILLCCSMASICMPGYWFGFLISIIFFGLTMTCGMAKSYGKVMLSVLVIFVFLLIIARALFYGSGRVLYQLGSFSIYEEGLKEGLRKSSVIMGFSSAIVFVATTTDLESLMLSLEQHKCPPNATFVILSTFQMIPQMSANAKVIQDAQRARGIETEGNLKARVRAFLPMLLPLLISSFSTAEEKSLALETRGFNYPCEKTRLRTVTDTNTQKVFRYAFTVVSVIACIVGGYFKWVA